MSAGATGVQSVPWWRAGRAGSPPIRYRSDIPNLDDECFDESSIRIQGCQDRQDGQPFMTAPLSRVYGIDHTLGTHGSFADFTRRLGLKCRGVVIVGFLPVGCRGASLVGNLRSSAT